MSKLTDNQRVSRWPSFTLMIGIGVVLGVGLGVFFGDLCTHIKWIGDVYVGLLQMTVLPYIVVSLIANVGRLSFKEGPRLAGIGLLVMTLLWLIGIVVLYAMTFAFPEWDTGSFYSTSFVEEPPTPKWLDLFVPSNPFRSMADGAVPAVVMFSMGVGTALIAFPNKSILLEPLSMMADALAQLNKLIVRMSPVGMCAIVAHAVGTTQLDQLALIQGYLVTYGVASLLLVFCILPACVAALTPLSMRQVILASWDALAAAFVIGNTFVVLPMIIDSTTKLLESSDARPSDEHAPEYLVPVSYPFPDVGRIVGLVFIWFAAWFYGSSIDGSQSASVLGVGFLAAFGKPVVTIPLLLDLADLPSDIFGLYLASGVVAARFGDLMKAMHLVSFTLLTSYALSGAIQWNLPKLLSRIVIASVLLTASILSIRLYLYHGFEADYAKDQLITERSPLIPMAHEDRVLATSTPNPVPIADGQSRLERIRRRGWLRIGFQPQKRPFSYRNSFGLVGLDIDMARQLAVDLGVGIEFVPIQKSHLSEQLEDDHIDIAMTGVEASIRQASSLPSVGPYMEVTPAVVLLDRRKHEFRELSQYIDKQDLKLAVVEHGYSSERLEHDLPHATIVRLSTESEFFDGVYEHVDGLVTTAETGSAWTLTHPEFSVANPLGGKVRVPLYYATASDYAFQQFLESWLELQRTNGTLESLYQYWILGKNQQAPARNWSVVRDVLGYDH